MAAPTLYTSEPPRMLPDRMNTAERLCPSPDRLGKILARDLDLSNTMPLLDLLRMHRGQSNIPSDVLHLPHPARHLLHHLGTNGAPVVFTIPPWTVAQKDLAIQHGPHKSSHEYVGFLREELADMVERVTWMVLPYHRLRERPNLRISPMGVVPQHERRPRPIVDYSFSYVNHDTVPLSPPEAMQFGRALERLLSQIVHSNPRFGPVRFIKVAHCGRLLPRLAPPGGCPQAGCCRPSLPTRATPSGHPPILAHGLDTIPPLLLCGHRTIADVANLHLHKRRRPALHRAP